MGSIEKEKVIMRKRKRKKSEFSKLRSYRSRDWRNALSIIENDFLKIHIACIIFWDFYDEERKKCPVYLKKIVRSYDSFPQSTFYLFFTEDETYKELRRIGYPHRLAKKRSYYDKKEYQDE